MSDCRAGSRGVAALERQILFLRLQVTLVFRSGVLECEDQQRQLLTSCHVANVGYKTFLRKLRKKLYPSMSRRALLSRRAMQGTAMFNTHNVRSLSL